MKEKKFKFSGFLYLHHEDHGTQYLETKAFQILSERFVDFAVFKVEHRQEANETAVSFATVVKGHSENEASTRFWNQVKEHDVDNVGVKEVTESIPTNEILYQPR